MKCLVISDTFPNCVEPDRGPYNRQQVEALAKLCRVTVVNPISWLRVMRRPGLLSAVKNGSDGLLANVRTAHPLHIHVPVLGRAMLGHSLYRSVCKHTTQAAVEEGLDVVYSTWAFPHGYAAMRLAREHGKPYVVELRGSDINALPASGLRYRLTACTLARAGAVVAVSRELGSKAVAMGVAPERTHVLHNGVDPERFRPMERRIARERLRLPHERRIILFVGNLLRVKGPDLLLEAFARISGRSGALLSVVGAGPLSKRLQAQAARLGIRERVRFIGLISHREVSFWVNAADLVCLPSRSEGCPCVVLEALACGTPVVASRVGAVPDLLDETCGVMAEPGDSAELAHGIRTVLSRDWDRAAIRRRVEGMSWQANAERLHGILQAVVSSNKVRLKGSSGCSGFMGTNRCQRLSAKQSSCTRGSWKEGAS